MTERVEILLDLVNQLEALLGSRGAVYDELDVSGTHFNRAINPPFSYSKKVEILIRKAQNSLAKLNVASDAPEQYDTDGKKPKPEEPTMTERVNFVENGLIRLENVMIAMAEFIVSPQTDEDKRILKHKLSSEKLKIDPPDVKSNSPIEKPAKKSPKKKGNKDI